MLAIGWNIWSHCFCFVLIDAGETKTLDTNWVKHYFFPGVGKGEDWTIVITPPKKKNVQKSQLLFIGGGPKNCPDIALLISIINK